MDHLGGHILSSLTLPEPNPAAFQHLASIEIKPDPQGSAHQGHTNRKEVSGMHIGYHIIIISVVTSARAKMR